MFQNGMNLYQFVRSRPSRWLDPFGRKIVVQEPDPQIFPGRKGDFLQSVLNAFSQMCPCVKFSLADIVNAPIIDEGRRGQKGQDSGRTATRASVYVQVAAKDDFCDCWNHHAVGCSLLRDLLMHPGVVRIGYSKSQREHEPNQGAPQGGVQPFVYWDPLFKSSMSTLPITEFPDVLANNDPLNAVADLAHELSHA